jgi:hypothetical protein
MASVHTIQDPKAALTSNDYCLRRTNCMRIVTGVLRELWVRAMSDMWPCLIVPTNVGTYVYRLAQIQYAWARPQSSHL